MIFYVDADRLIITVAVAVVDVATLHSQVVHWLYLAVVTGVQGGTAAQFAVLVYYNQFWPHAYLELFQHGLLEQEWFVHDRIEL